jgi:hypothetical protein
MGAEGGGRSGGTHGKDEAGNKELERGGIEDAAGALLISHESSCQLRLFLGATSSPIQISRHYSAV